MRITDGGRMHSKYVLTIAALLTASLAVALQGDGTISYSRDVEPIFLKACGDCHDADSPKKGLDLSKGKGFLHLIGVPSQEMNGQALVKPGDPTASYLWVKLTHMQTEGRGMPRTIFSSKKLPKEQLDVVERWIKAGAKP